MSRRGVQSAAVPGFNSAGFVVLNVLAAGYALLVVPIVNYGADWMYLRFMRDEQPNVGDIFAGFKKGYLNIVLASLLVVAICGIGFLLVIVPGIIFACRLAFVPYLVMDKGLDPVGAIEKSWFMTRGHGWRIFFMYLLSIVMVFCGLILLIVPGLFALDVVRHRVRVALSRRRSRGASAPESERRRGRNRRCLGSRSGHSPPFFRLLRDPGRSLMRAPFFSVQFPSGISNSG